MFITQTRQFAFTLALAISVFASMTNASLATTVLNFTKLASAGSTPLHINHVGSTHQSTITSGSPIAVNIGIAAFPGMIGNAFLSFVNVTSSAIPLVSGNLSSQDAFSGSLIFSKSASDHSGSNLVLEADFTNAFLSLSGGGGTFRASNDDTIPQTLNLISAYGFFGGDTDLSLSFSTVTPTTGFSSPDQDLNVVLDPTGVISASIVSVPEPSTLVSASFASLVLMGSYLRKHPWLFV